MQPIGVILEAGAAEQMSLAVVLGFFALTFLIGLIGLQLTEGKVQRARPVVAQPIRSRPAQPQPKREWQPIGEWGRVTQGVYKHLARAEKLPALQARVSSQIDAVEYDLARLLADCASVGSHFKRPQPEPLLTMVRQAKPVSTLQTLAA